MPKSKPEQGAQPERSAKPDLTKDEAGFTKMQRAFLEAYLGPARYNATKAAKQAGYSKKTAYSIGSELTKKPHIRAAIDEDLEEHARRCRATVEARIGRSIRWKLPEPDREK